MRDLHGTGFSIKALPYAGGDDAGGFAGRFDIQSAVLDGKTRVIVR